MADDLCYVHYIVRDANGDCPKCEENAKLPKRPPVKVYYKQFMPYYNIGLGCMINSKRHYQQVLKEKNCVEVGDCRVEQYKPKGRI